MKDVCKTCRFFVMWGSQSGECRRNAPLARPEEGLGARALFPQVWAETTWCGEHRPVEPAALDIVQVVCGGCFHHKQSHRGGHPYDCLIAGCSCNSFDERPQPKIDASRSRVNVCNTSAGTTSASTWTSTASACTFAVTVSVSCFERGV